MFYQNPNTTHVTELKAGAPTMGGYARLAPAGLASMYRRSNRRFAHTLRGVNTGTGPALMREGVSVRYTAITALGLGHCDDATQRAVLDGESAADLTRHLLRDADSLHEPGELALVAWAAAEVAGIVDADLFARLRVLLEHGDPLATVPTAWMLTAATAARSVSSEQVDVQVVMRKAGRRLMDSQHGSGLFPHGLPTSSAAALRRHLACFADQVYPIQALARLARATTDPDAMLAANRCAARIVALQGDEGQWWWHYDVRDGSVAERYPVYSVHQHAMAPMALFDLAECGGDDHTDAALKGVDWLHIHPEVFSELVDEEHAVIWRKVARRGRRTARTAAALTTSVKPGWHPPGVDWALPANVIDRECRPYELGWLLYAWNSRAGRTIIRPAVPMAGQAPVKSRQPRALLYGMEVDAVTMPEVIERCHGAIASHTPIRIGMVNAAKVIKLRSDAQLRESLAECDLVLADGQSVVWASKVLGDALPERVAGIDLFESLLGLANDHAYGVYLLGARPEVLSAVEAQIARRYPRARIVGSRHGYFTDEEADAVAAGIAASGADMVFLGMTTPKKEHFVGHFSQDLDIPVMHGVGGAFDVMAGLVERAPLAWQRAGMEWAYRLKQEPRRLTMRYVRTNSAFVAATAREFVHRSRL
ncbi:WecB/TagA/CpsF family glycosyltransferase [Kribbia dieselivorans]|uniref:WecB/TagA/CpsF family glycosyltransferase n=1 Tax=Kribbia dieselivorans TaxID=331526 RepID=UPI000AC64D1E|nr:WecB/TagA/CpsF family glycosyltransferase [Kribbia dieselivorans]